MRLYKQFGSLWRKPKSKHLLSFYINGFGPMWGKMLALAAMAAVAAAAVAAAAPPPAAVPMPVTAAAAAAKAAAMAVAAAMTNRSFKVRPRRKNDAQSWLHACNSVCVTPVGTCVHHLRGCAFVAASLNKLVCFA